ncbi:MAG: hypothetical protein IKU36_04145 [Bacteroidales bacterium]|nr:hypothetical protein [Bacteroidales bacterium]
MAIYRTVQMTFWTDAKVVDDFTPEDRYFYLYLFTNPHTNLSGCYEISKRQMSIETGYTVEVIERLMARFKEQHKVIEYDSATKEILLLNWHRYNWTNSRDFRKALEREISSIKSDGFRAYIHAVLDGVETVPRPSLDGVGTTVTVPVTVTDTVSVSDTVTVPVTDKAKKSKKIQFGEYKNVLLTDEEHKKLCDDYGDRRTAEAITYLDEYIEMKGAKYKSHYLAMRKWVFDAIEEKQGKSKPINQTAQELEEFYSMSSEWAEKMKGGAYDT